MSTAQLNLDIKSHLTGELFAGFGGFGQAYYEATGQYTDIAINHSDNAISVHKANHPQTEHYITDVYDVDPVLALKGRPLGHLHMSPDCFPAGTMILTAEGYKAIETLKINDMVMTHLGRWRPITSVMSRLNNIKEIRGHGHQGIRVSNEHPFYVSTRKKVWNNDIRQYKTEFTEPDWVKVRDLTKENYWATPIYFDSLNIPSMSTELGTISLPIDERLMWLVGRYLGDGWTRLNKRRGELVIICGKHEADDLSRTLDKWPRKFGRAKGEELGWLRRETRTSVQFSTNSRALVTWLRDNFGHLAAKKRIPGWVFGMSKEMREALLSGYLSADGWNGKDSNGVGLKEANTISAALAFGIKSLATSLGENVLLYKQANRNLIEGRRVNANDIYKIRWRVTSKHAQTFIKGIHRFSPIREIINIDGFHEVFNISVLEDESYIAETIVVHNCTHFSQAAGGQPRDTKIRSLSWVGIKWIGQARPLTLSFENVLAVTSWGPLIAKRDKATGLVVRKDGTLAKKGEVVPRHEQFLVPDPSRKGKTWKRFISIIKSYGYDVAWQTMRGADFGGHTTRDRLFMAARRDGVPVTFPTPTHFKKPARGQKKWLGAHECIDFNLPSNSIFNRKKPLATATLKRVARGLKKYVIDSDTPFVVEVKPQIATSDMPPVSTPIMIQAGHGDGKSGGVKRWGNGYKSVRDPLGTVTGSGGHALATPILAKFRGDSIGHDLREPMPTVTAGGVTKRPAGNGHALGLITAHIAQMNGGFNTNPGHDLNSPLSTITNTGSQQQLVTANLVTLRKNCIGIGVDEPLPTVTADGQHHALVQCKLSQDNIEGALHVAEFMYTYMTDEPQLKSFASLSLDEKFALVTVHVNGVAHVIVDICLRMLIARELIRCMDFPEDYIIDRGHDGRAITKTQMVHMIGNSISIPPVVALLKELFKSSKMRLVA